MGIDTPEINSPEMVMNLTMLDVVFIKSGIYSIKYLFFGV
jgi:hypothetical protein